MRSILGHAASLLAKTQAEPERVAYVPTHYRVPGPRTRDSVEDAWMDAIVYGTGWLRTQEDPTE